MATGPIPATAPRKKNPKIVTQEEHAIIQEKCSIQGDEDYAVVLQKGKGFWKKSIHVFARQPNTKELQQFEDSSSKLKFKGQQAQMEGSPLLAAGWLYNLLIVRAYDVLVGLKTYEQLDRPEAARLVPPVVKREAVRELVGEVYSASRMEEAEGVAEQSTEDEAKDDDLEAHTSGGSQG